MQGYSASTTASGAVAVAMWPASVMALAYSAKLLHSHRKRSSGVEFSGVCSRSSLFLHLCFLLGNVCALVATTLVVATSWIHVQPDASGTGSDLFQLGSRGLDASTQACVAMVKTGSAVYVCAKMFSFLLMFIKQHTVRPSSRPSVLEQITFALTVCMAPLGVILALVMTRAERNGADSTCQPSIDSSTGAIVVLANLTLGALYLILFLGALRTTVRSNRAAQRAAEILARTQGRFLTLAPVVHVELEATQRKNAAACAVSVSVSLACMPFMLAAQFSDGAAARKWVALCGAVDLLVSSLATAAIVRNNRTAPQPAAVAPISRLVAGVLTVQAPLTPQRKDPSPVAQGTTPTVVTTDLTSPTNSLKRAGAGYSHPPVAFVFPLHASSAQATSPLSMPTLPPPLSPSPRAWSATFPPSPIRPASPHTAGQVTPPAQVIRSITPMTSARLSARAPSPQQLQLPRALSPLLLPPGVPIDALAPLFLPPACNRVSFSGGTDKPPMRPRSKTPC